MDAPIAGTARAAAGWWTEQGQAVKLAGLLLLHAAVWAWAGTASRTNLDLTGDMLEAFAWGQGFEWGYHKHPPLMAWMAGAWFALMPVTEASYALLAALNTTLGLAGFVCLAREFLPRRWCWVALAAAMLTPGTTTMALRFNANTVLVATWPWVSAFFVRFMHRGGWADALACAVAGALAMLGKYFSAVLLLALVLSAIVYPPWRPRLASRPWLGALALLALLLAAHVVWLGENAYGPLAYMREATHDAADSALRRAVHFGYSHLAYPALGFGLLVTTVLGPRRRPLVRAALFDLLRPSVSPAWLIALLPVVLTVAGTAITGARTSVVWGLPMSLGLILLFATRLAAQGLWPQPRAAAVYLSTVWIVAIVASPIAWWLDARRQAPAAADPRAELAQAVASDWAASYGTPLRWVAGSTAYAQAVSFYADGHPRYWALAETRRLSPWADAAALRAAGGVIVCDPGDAGCMSLAGRLAGPGRRLTVAKRTRGFVFEARSFSVFDLPPASDAASRAASAAAAAR